MISNFREFTKSWIFKGLMVLLVVSFAVFGLNNIFTAAPTNEVVNAGDRKVTATEFRNRLDNIRRSMEEKGQPFTYEQFVDAQQHTLMLNELGNQLAFASWLDGLGVKPSTKLLFAEVGKIQAFQNSVTGRFDHDTYTQALANAKVGVDTFEAETRDQIAINQFLHAAQAGLKAPRIFAAADAAFTVQSRDASLFLLSPESVPTPAAPTDAELEAYYRENQKRFEQPELRTASVVLFSAQPYLKDVTVSEEDLRKVYDFRRDSLATPETRSFVQVTAPDMAAANRIVAALKSGQTPEAAAKANKGEVITYDQKPRTAISDSKIAAAAFGMKTGEVSDAIQGDLSASVVKMGDIRIGSTPSFESVRAQIEQELRLDRAKEKLNEVTHAFSEAVGKGDDLETAAGRLGLKVQPLLPMNAEGKTGQQVNYTSYEPLVKAVFELPQVGNTSDVASLGEDQFFAVKLTGLKPAGAPPLADIRKDLAMLMTQEKLQAAIEAEAEKAQARLAKGESLASVAASYKSRVQTIPGITRQTAQQSQIPQQVLSRIFTSKAGESFHVQAAPLQVAVGRLDAVNQGDPALANSLSAMTSPQVTQLVARDVSSLTQGSASKSVKVKTNPNAAIRALGIDPASKTAADDKGKS